MDFLEILNNFKITDEDLFEIYKRQKCNDVIEEYFEHYAKDQNDIDERYSLKRIGGRIKGCHTIWETERTESLKVSDVKSINLCHSKFCSNCQKLMQATRLYKMHDVLDIAFEKYDLYHTVFTLRNVDEFMLRKTLDIMKEAFAVLIRYFKGAVKIKGIDFAEYGYVAAVRSFEIVFSDKKGYHPHIHAIFSLRKDLDMPKVHRNKYSYSYIDGKKIWVRDFSDFEILLQKIWYTLIDNYRHRNAKLSVSKNCNKKIRSKRITASDIEKLKEGYSCICDRIEDRNGVYEVFKYIFKLVSDNNNIMSYETFVTLYEVTKNFKQFQTYGAWRNINLDDDIDLSGAALYAAFVKFLNTNGKSSEVFLTLNDIMSDSKEGYSIITKYRVMQYINGIPKEKKEYYSEHLNEFVVEYKKEMRVKRAMKFLKHTDSVGGNIHDKPILLDKANLKKHIKRLSADKVIEYSHLTLKELEKQFLLKESAQQNATPPVEPQLKKIEPKQLRIDFNKVGRISDHAPEE